MRAFKNRAGRFPTSLGSNVNPPITDPWMAPEATATDKPFYGHAADVYGFGLIAIYLRSVHVFTKQF